jgi:hypothetical protein
MNQANIGLALQILYDLLRHANELSALIGKAHAEQRDLTEEEVSGVASADDLARARLQKAIDEVDPPKQQAALSPPGDPLDAGHLD